MGVWVRGCGYKWGIKGEKKGNFRLGAGRLWCTVIILDPLADILKMVRKPKIKAGFQVRPDVQQAFFYKNTRNFLFWKRCLR